MDPAAGSSICHTSGFPALPKETGQSSQHDRLQMQSGVGSSFKTGPSADDIAKADEEMHHWQNNAPALSALTADTVSTTTPAELNATRAIGPSTPYERLRNIAGHLQRSHLDKTNAELAWAWARNETTAKAEANASPAMLEDKISRLQVVCARQELSAAEHLQVAKQLRELAKNDELQSAQMGHLARCAHGLREHLVRADCDEKQHSLVCDAIADLLWHEKTPQAALPDLLRDLDALLDHPKTLPQDVTALANGLTGVSQILPSTREIEQTTLALFRKMAQQPNLKSKTFEDISDGYADQLALAAENLPINEAVRIIDELRQMRMRPELTPESNQIVYENHIGALMNIMRRHDLPQPVFADLFAEIHHLRHGTEKDTARNSKLFLNMSSQLQEPRQLTSFLEKLQAIRTSEFATKEEFERLIHTYSNLRRGPLPQAVTQIIASELAALDGHELDSQILDRLHEQLRDIVRSIPEDAPTHRAIATQLAQNYQLHRGLPERQLTSLQALATPNLRFVLDDRLSQELVGDLLHMDQYPQYTPTQRRGMLEALADLAQQPMYPEALRAQMSAKFAQQYRDPERTPAQNVEALYVLSQRDFRKALSSNDISMYLEHMQHILQQPLTDEVRQLAAESCLNLFVERIEKHGDDLPELTATLHQVREHLEKTELNNTLHEHFGNVISSIALRADNTPLELEVLQTIEQLHNQQSLLTPSGYFHLACGLGHMATRSANPGTIAFARRILERMEADPNASGMAMALGVVPSLQYLRRTDTN